MKERLNQLFPRLRKVGILGAGISGKGMPIGVQIIADAFNENKMFNIAYNLEGMLGFNQKPAIKESPND